MINIGSEIALVVGGGRGIGAAIVEALALEGADVWVFDTNLVQDTVNHYLSTQISGYKAACELRCRLLQKGHEIRVLDVDACSEQEVIQGLSEIADSSGSVSILVNALGSTHVGNTVDTTLKEFTSIINTNLIAPYITCREVSKVMLATGNGGSIVNIGSISGKMGFPWISSYCAAKAGLGAFTTSLSLELAQHKIQVNAVCPGIVRTNMWQYLREKLENENETEEVFWERMHEMIPQGRTQSVEAIANLVVSVIKNDEITGQSFSIDGGMNRYG